jgi:hypothetical protein
MDGPGSFGRGRVRLKGKYEHLRNYRNWLRHRGHRDVHRGADLLRTEGSGGTPEDYPAVIFHGHKTSNYPTYRSWAQMIQRTTNPNNGRWEDYGGRGISVCERWRSFIAFLSDMGERPDGTQLDRVDNNASYSPENCRWATRSQQQNNRRNNRLISFNGETRSATEWSRLLGFPRGLITTRLKSGWSVEAILSTPVQKGPKPFCPSGHPMSGTNLRFSSTGTRQCVICRRAYARRFYLATKSQNQQEKLKRTAQR